MDEQPNLVPRDRGNGGEPVETLAPRTFLTLDMMPREPHLLDYLMILRKHQWLIVSFFLRLSPSSRLPPSACSRFMKLPLESRSIEKIPASFPSMGQTAMTRR